MPCSHLHPAACLPVCPCCCSPPPTPQVHAKSDACNRYLVVLDAAAHAASHVLDLSAVTPDFVTLSFYKV